MPGSWTSPSGSRWEPAPGTDATAASYPTAPADVGTGSEVPEAHGPAGRPARRRGGPVLVALVALLSLGGLGAGAYAYERSGDDAPVAAAARQAGARPDGTGGTGLRHDGGHRRADGDGSALPGTDGGR